MNQQNLSLFTLTFLPVKNIACELALVNRPRTNFFLDEENLVAKHYFPWAYEVCDRKTLLTIAAHTDRNNF